MNPQGEDLLKPMVVRDGTALLKAGHQSPRQVFCAGMNPQGEELIKHWLCGMESTCRRGACFFCNLKNPHLEWFQNVDL